MFDFCACHVFRQTLHAGGPVLNDGVSACDCETSSVPLEVDRPQSTRQEVATVALVELEVRLLLQSWMLLKLPQQL